MQRARRLVSVFDMTLTPAPLSLPDTAPEMARRFGEILAALAALVARRFLRDPQFASVIVPLWSWLGRAARRMARAVERPPVVRTARVAKDRAEPQAGARVRPVRLPSRHGWLVRALGWEAAGYGSQLAALLAEPGMQAVLAALPGTGRILRPLCRMLGMTVPPVVARPKPARKKRVRLPVWPARKARRPLVEFGRRRSAIVFSD